MADATSRSSDPASQIQGRLPERQALRQRLTALRTGPGGVALVSGEAGIGKTTLVEEAVAQVETSGVLVLSGSCYDLTTTPPYGPWIDIARRYWSDGSLPVFPVNPALSDDIVLFLWPPGWPVAAARRLIHSA